MTPACGPPSSLSPLNVTSAAPSASDCIAAGSPASHAGGGPSSQGHRASIKPLPMSATTGTPSVDNPAMVVSSVNPSHPVVARVHLEDERGIDVGPGERPLVVGEARAVRRADVDEPRSGLLHHLRDAERPADLDALATADRNVAPRRQRGDDEQHRGRVVVDDHRVVGAAQPGEEPADRCLPRAALAGRQIELDRRAPGVLMMATGARPRLVCSSTPVALTTRVSSVRRNASARSRAPVDVAGGDRLAGDVDADRVRQTGRAQRAGELVHRRWTRRGALMCCPTARRTCPEA